MKYLIAFLILCNAATAQAQVTYFNSAVNPADNGTLAASPVTVTPPGSMTTGDLVVMYAYQRGSATFAIGTTGGQSWNQISGNAAGQLYGDFFWCVYNGTWAANPTVTFSATTNTSVVMHVFRPTSTSYTWGVDQSLSIGSVAAPSSPFTVTITGQTITNSSGVTLAGWHTADDNTWGSLSGSGWTVTGGAQYRNLAGQDVSTTWAHYIHTSASSSTGNVSKNQATLGGDNTATYIITFYEYIPPDRRIFIIN